MPLTDLVRHLNRHHRSQNSGLQAQEPFLTTARGILGRFADLHIETDFYALNDHQGRLQGHAANVRAYGAISRQSLDTDTVFMLAESDAEFIYLDRMLRTLHVLNYLNLRMSDTLLLKLHPRLVQTAGDHRGLGFDEILHTCNLLPDSVTFEFDMDCGSSTEQLKLAIEIYRARGYGIAVSNFENRSTGIAELLAIRPDIVRIDHRISRTAGELHALSKAIGATGAKSLACGGTVSAEIAARIGIDLLQAAKPDMLIVKESPQLHRSFPSARVQRNFVHDSSR